MTKDRKNSTESHLIFLLEDLNDILEKLHQDGVIEKTSIEPYIEKMELPTENFGDQRFITKIQPSSIKEGLNILQAFSEYLKNGSLINKIEPVEPQEPDLAFHGFLNLEYKNPVILFYNDKNIAVRSNNDNPPIHLFFGSNTVEIEESFKIHRVFKAEEIRLFFKSIITQLESELINRQMEENQEKPTQKKKLSIL